MGKVLSTLKKAPATVLKFGAAAGVGVVGSGVLLGTSAYNKMERSLEGMASGLQLALLNSMSFSRMEENASTRWWEMSNQKNRNGFSWAMASTAMDNQQQYGG